MILARFSLPRLAALSGVLLWTLVAAALGLALVALVSLRAIQSDNAAIMALTSRKDIEVSATGASPPVALARINELLRRDRFDEAQAFLVASAGRMDTHTRSAALYNVANAEVRRALAELTKGDLDAASAHVGLAKAGYRIALRLDPDNWGARNNMDVAMRIVRDLPQAEGEDRKEQEKPVSNWTDLPGVPKGLP